jgi:hypothetical protein
MRRTPLTTNREVVHNILKVARGEENNVDDNCHTSKCCGSVILLPLITPPPVILRKKGHTDCPKQAPLSFPRSPAVLRIWDETLRDGVMDQNAGYRLQGALITKYMMKLGNIQATRPTPVTKARQRRRLRHQARRPATANRPGNPIPTLGTGTVVRLRLASWKENGEPL